MAGTRLPMTGGGLDVGLQRARALTAQRHGPVRCRRLVSECLI